MLCIFSVVNTSTSNFSDVSTSSAQLSVFEIIVYAFLAIVTSLLTGFGNLMVLISFRIEKQLQTISNYFLMSLAVADLVIGFISMPIYTIYLLMGTWPFGFIVCDLYLALDYTICNASAANLLIISIDRYRSVTSPLAYRAHRTPKKVLTMIALAWIISIFLWSPWIMLYPVFKGRQVSEGDCQVEFISNNVYLSFFTCIMAFFLPVTIMTILYVRVFQETKKRQKELKLLQATHSSSTRKDCLIRSTSNASEKSTADGKRGCCLSLRRCVRSIMDNDEFSEHDMTESCSFREDRPVSTANFPLSSSYYRCNYQSGRRGRPAESSLAALEPRPTVVSQGSIEEVEESDLSYIVWIKVPGSEADKPRIQLRCKKVPKSLYDKCKDEDVRPIDPPRNRAGLNSVNSVQNSATEKVKKMAVGDDTAAVSRLDSGRSNLTADSGISSITDTNNQTPRPKTDSNQNHNNTNEHPIRKQSVQTPSFVPKRSANDQKKKESKSEQKAAKTLSAILLVFVVTWFPYMLFTIIRAVYRHNCPKRELYDNLIPDTVYNFGYWLCYLNSTMNPVCYALCNANFRRTFWRIMTCQWGKRPTLSRLGQGLYKQTRLLPNVTKTDLTRRAL